MSDDYLDRAEGTSPASATRRGISAVILSVFGGMILLVEAFFDGLAEILGVMNDFRDFIGSFFVEPVRILEVTAEYTAFSLTQGDWAFFGPGTFAMGVLSIILGWAVWNTFDPEIPFIDDLLPWR